MIDDNINLFSGTLRRVAKTMAASIKSELDIEFGKTARTAPTTTTRMPLFAPSAPWQDQPETKTATGDLLQPSKPWESNGGSDDCGM